MNFLNAWELGGVALIFVWKLRARRRAKVQRPGQSGSDKDVVEVSIRFSGHVVSLSARRSGPRPAGSFPEREAALDAAQAALRQIQSQIRQASGSRNTTARDQPGGPPARSGRPPRKHQGTEGKRGARAVLPRQTSILAYREYRVPASGHETAT